MCIVKTSVFAEDKLISNFKTNAAGLVLHISGVQLVQ